MDTHGPSLSLTIRSRTMQSGLRALALLILGTLLALQALSPQAAFADSYVVDKSGDDAGATACTGAPDDCSLRGALSKAATNAGADTITFDPSKFPPDTTASLPPGQTITIGTALPDLSNDGDTVNAVVGSVAVDASSTGFNCFTVSGNGNVIKGIDVIMGCSVGVAVTGSGNTIGGSNTPEIVCTGSADEDGDAYVNDGCPAVGAPETPNQCANPADNDSDGSTNDGCPPRGEGMTIRVNTTAGISISGETADTNVVAGNYIGTNRPGDVTAPNGTGVVIEGGADGNTIGGSTAGERNIISGNASYGVTISGVSATSNTISGNYIGVAVDGATDMGNALAGVAIASGASTNTIGGPTAAHGNVIAGNDIWGVRISGAAETVGYAECADAVDQDADAFVNDGCPIIGAAESGVQCSNAINDDSGEDSLVNDGCPIAGTNTTGNLVKANYIGLNAAGTVGLGNGQHGVIIERGAQTNTVGGSTADERNVISGNNAGVIIVDFHTDGNTIKGNYIGTNPAGTAAIANAGGVRIELNAPANNTVGGSAAGEGNVISGNTNHGVSIAGSSGNTVLGNYIGTNAAGTAPVGNGSDGVHITGGATGNAVGGGSPGERNLISGNAGDGVEINGSGTTGNIVRGNFIGTNAAGTAAIGNASYGVAVLLAATGNTIGGTAAGEGNVISGNNSDGVGIGNAGTSGNLVQGNLIGTNAAGTGLVANLAGGVFVGFSGNTVGGTSAGAGNVIAGGSNGVSLGGGGGSSNVVQGNFIGTDRTGTLDLGSTAYGVWAGEPNNTIGGTAAGAGNMIAFSDGPGVCVLNAGATGNSIRGNGIYSNGKLGIDIKPAGEGACSDAGVVTTNDAGDGDTGPNNLQNFPTIMGATYNGTVTTISGEGPTFAAGTYQIDIYASQVADSSGNGEGQAYVGSMAFVAPGTWNYVTAGLPPFAVLTATATDGAGNTSEFSPAFHTDLDGDGFSSTTDNCPLAYNPLQLDHDADGVGDVCDPVVRNRWTFSSSSLIDEYSTAPGDDIRVENQTFFQWDFESGASMDIGAVVGDADFSYQLSVNNGPCTVGAYFPDRPLINASIDSSPGNLVDNAGIMLDDDSDGLKNGVEKFPRFLTTLLDPQRLTNIDNDNDGAIDEGPEDPAGTLDTLHARYFGAYDASAYFQILIFEVIPNQLYRRVVVYNDPTSTSYYSTSFCSPHEHRITIQNASADNPATISITEGPEPALGSATAGQHVSRLEMAERPDGDGDGYSNYRDNCATVTNASQADGDADGIGDACDPSPGVDTGAGDHDGDLIKNTPDNCPTVDNASQAESEKRTPLPFGWGLLGDDIGDGCDANPTLVDGLDEIAVVRFSDGVCVTGGGFADADADGWCDSVDPSDSDAARTPENDALSPASCNNGVNDDAEGGADFADADCADADGDTIPDNVDVCDAAADPLQLDSDGDGQGDACESAVIADLDVFPALPATVAESRGRLVEPAPFMLHRNGGGIALLTDPGWAIATGASVPDGGIREALSMAITAAVAPSHTCNTTLPLNFTLVDASTNPADTIAPGANFGGLLGDTSPANGLPDGVDKMPSFLLKLPQLSVGIDNDGDFNIDEDPYDSLDNDADGSVDEDQYDVTPIVRMFASTTLGGANTVANVLIYSPGVLVPFTDPAGQGYPALLVLGDPTSPLPATSISALCSSQDIRHIRYGVSLDNPATAAVEAPTTLLTTSASGTRLFFTRIFTQPDADSDRIENSLDTCVTVRDNDADTINDDIDASPWNPRLVSPPGDADGDGIPAGCDPSPLLFGGGGSFFASASAALTLTTCTSTLPNDCDGDGVNNTADNCPFDANTSQADEDGDGIGNPCDPAPTAPTGAIQQVVAGTPVCVGTIGGDNDKDGYCSAQDPNDNDAKITQEDSTYDPLKCTNTVDDDEDLLVDLNDNNPPPACQDVDNDLVLNQADNCPTTPNANQVDNDIDGQVGQQPFSRSDLGDITIMGQPFSRSAKYGGDACDPDDDNDGLADGSDPCPTDLDKDCDNDLLQDVVEWTFSTLNTLTDPPQPPVRCLHPNDSDYWPNPPAGNGQSDWKDNLDGDAMFTYSEALIGTDPCVSDDPLGVDGDLDGFKTGLELYTTTSPTIKCAATTLVNDEAVDAQVTDNNDDRRSALSDILAYIPVFNAQLPSTAFNRRYDLNVDGKVALADILGFIPFFNQLCTP